MDIRFYCNMVHFFGLTPENEVKNLHKIILILSVVFLCSFVIILSLSGKWEICLIVTFFSLFFVFLLKNHWSFFLLILLFITPNLEKIFNIKLGSTQGISLMNFCLVSGFMLFMIMNMKSEKRFTKPQYK